MFELHYWPGSWVSDPLPLPYFNGFRIRIHFLRIRSRIRIQMIRVDANTDPDTDPDPDPIQIRIQSGSRALMTKNWKKITAEKKINFFLIKNCNLPIPRPP
jgi:hypothetical protein